MTARNDITGDKIQTKSPSKEYETNYDRIFRQPKQQELDLGDVEVSSDKSNSARKSQE